MYKNSRIRYAGKMASAAANTTLATRLHLATLPNVPKVQLSFAAGQPGGNRVIELYLATFGESDTITCRVWQAKEIARTDGSVAGYVVSPFCTISAESGTDQSGAFSDAAYAEPPYICHTYSVDVSTDATTPKGIGATVASAYGGGVVAYSPTDGGDARVIISDVGNADFLLFDVWGSSAFDRFVFVEGGV